MQAMENEQSMTRQEALAELGRYGIHGSYIYLIDVVPLIEMIWADGKIQDIEVAVFNYYLSQHIENINGVAGYPVLTLEEAQTFISIFLEERPNPEYLRALRGLIPAIRLSSPQADENKATWEFIISGCLDIASSAVPSYPYELTERFNILEKRCLFEILETLHY
jgi:hypothetical protein